MTPGSDASLGGAASVSDGTGARVRPPRRRIRNPVPPEGEGGFSQTWFPICHGADVAAGEVIGRDFLDGRVLVMRGHSGRVAVMSAYCPHLGADLALGTVTSDHLRCAFHHFLFDGDGRCVATGVGDPVPKHAQLFKFPTLERHGIVWAFNGDEATWDLPTFDQSESPLVWRHYPALTLRCDPWTVIANTADFQHFHFLHGFEFDFAATAQAYQWHDNGVTADLHAALPDRQAASEVHYHVTHLGTNLTTVRATIDGSVAHLLIGFGIPRPGETEIFTAVAAARSGSEGVNPQIEPVLDQLEQVFGLMGSEDNPILDTAHFMPGTLTATDRQLVRFLQYVRHYPRAHPSADFIR